MPDACKSTPTTFIYRGAAIRRVQVRKAVPPDAGAFVGAVASCGMQLPVRFFGYSKKTLRIYTRSFATSMMTFMLI